MTTRTDREKMLLDHLETNASRLNVLSAMLSVLEETEPFSVNQQLTDDAQHARTLRAVQFFQGLCDLVACYHGDLSRAIDSCYRGSESARNQ